MSCQRKTESQEERISSKAPAEEQRLPATKRGGEAVDRPGGPKRTALNPATGTKRSAETSLDVLHPRSPEHPDESEERREGQVLLTEACGHVDGDPIELPEDSLEHLAEDDGRKLFGQGKGTGWRPMGSLPQCPEIRLLASM